MKFWTPRRVRKISKPSRVYSLLKIKRKRKKIFSFFLFLVFLTLIYFLFFSDFFKIKNILVEKEEIRNFIYPFLSKKTLIFSHDNIFFFNPSLVKREILKNFKEIEDLKIKKIIPNKLLIEIKEKEAKAILNREEKFYLLDKNGEIFKECSLPFSPEIANLPLIYDKREIENSFSRELINSVLELNQKIPQKINLKASYFELYDPFLKEIKVVTEEGWGIHFILQNIDQQLENLTMVLREKIRNQKIEYIDLRFGNKIYYK